MLLTFVLLQDEEFDDRKEDAVMSLVGVKVWRSYDT